MFEAWNYFLYVTAKPYAVLVICTAFYMVCGGLANIIKAMKGDK